MKTFDFAPGISLRVIEKDGEPWFVAKDVQTALGLTNIAATLALLDSDEKGINTVYTHGGPQQMNVVNEPGLYSLILRSRKPEAKTFKRWVTHEVLPTIRKTGGYMVPSVAVKVAENPMEAIARGLLIANEVIKGLQVSGKGATFHNDRTLSGRGSGWCISSPPDLRSVALRNTTGKPSGALSGSPSLCPVRGALAAYRCP
jgi:prophage antirepressor-like protein